MRLTNAALSLTYAALVESNKNPSLTVRGGAARGADARAGAD